MKKYFSILIVVFLFSWDIVAQHEVTAEEQSDAQREQRIHEAYEVAIGNKEGIIIGNRHSLMGQYYDSFVDHFLGRGMYIGDLVNIKYLLVDEGVLNSPQLSQHKVEYMERGLEGILFSPVVVYDPIKMKAVMYKALAFRLGLGLTQEDSVILQERTTDFDYGSLSEKDYGLFFQLIEKRLQEKYTFINVAVYDFQK